MKEGCCVVTCSTCGSAVAGSEMENDDDKREEGGVIKHADIAWTDAMERL